MPWRVQTPMSERRQFIDEYLRGTTSMTALCAGYGISRRIGYKWLTRFLVEGDRSLGDRSRRPRTSPWAIEPELVTLLLTARQRHPTWGPRKILAYLRPRHSQATLPAASTVGALFKRHGLVRPRRRRIRPGHLLDAHGAAVSRLTLMQQVWGYQADVLSRTVDSHVLELRRKLEPEPAVPRHILTVRKVGYRLER